MIQSNLRSLPTVAKGRNQTKPGKTVWQRIVDKMVMDGPAEWDIHPDVAKKLSEQTRISREIG